MNFFRKLIRALDLIFVVSERAQKAKMGAIVRGVSMEAMYDGGLAVQAEHILPEFKAGKPPVSVDTRIRVGHLGENGDLVETTAIYDPASDSFCFSNKPRPRELGDLWLLESDHEAAFARAVKRTSDPKCQPVSVSR